jgi:hypothetical protein
MLHEWSLKRLFLVVVPETGSSAAIGGEIGV